MQASRCSARKAVDEGMHVGPFVKAVKALSLAQFGTRVVRAHNGRNRCESPSGSR